MMGVEVIPASWVIYNSSFSVSFTTDWFSIADYANVDDTIIKTQGFHLIINIVMTSAWDSLMQCDIDEGPSTTNYITTNAFIFSPANASFEYILRNNYNRVSVYPILNVITISGRALLILKSIA